MRSRLPRPMSDPGQFQTTQAAARNATQDLIRRIGRNLHHGNQPGIQKDRTWRTWWSNVNWCKKWARKCRKLLTHRHNMRIFCQGREDNPLHTDAFNVLIENLKEKIHYGVGPLLIVNVQLQGHFLWKSKYSWRPLKLIFERENV